MRRCGGFGQAIAFNKTQAKLIQQALRHRLRHGGAATADVGQTGQIEFFNLRAAEQIDHHGRDVGPVRDLPLGNLMPSHVTVPTRHQHQRGAQENRGVHDTDHAGDVEHGHHGQSHIFRGAVAPQATCHGVVHDAAVRVHAALGQAGGAAGVRQDRQISAGGRHLGQGQVMRQRLRPGMHLAVGQRGQGAHRHQPIVPMGRQVLGACGHRVEHIGELRHQQMPQLLLRRQSVAGRRQFRCQIGGGDGHARVRVGDVVLELLHPVHRIDRHHHRIQSQNSKVRYHQLRAILHVQDHPVPLVHAQGGQIAGQFFGFMLEFGIGPSPAHEHQSQFIWVALGADL